MGDLKLETLLKNEILNSNMKYQIFYLGVLVVMLYPLMTPVSPINVGFNAPSLSLSLDLTKYDFIKKLKILIFLLVMLQSLSDPA